MKRLLVFLFCTGILMAVIAALMGTPGRLLLNGAAVLLITVWAIAACAPTPLEGHKK